MDKIYDVSGIRPITDTLTFSKRKSRNRKSSHSLYIQAIRFGHTKLAESRHMVTAPSGNVPDPSTPGNVLICTESSGLYSTISIPVGLISQYPNSYDGECLGSENSPCPPGSSSDCNGVCNGPSVYDCAGICFNPTVENPVNSRDCNGVCNGDAIIDCLGVCGGTGEYDCAGNCYDPEASTPPVARDCAGVCGGTSIPDCAGVCNGTCTEDCGVDMCEGTLCVNCEGECGGLSCTSCTYPGAPTILF